MFFLVLTDEIFSKALFTYWEKIAQGPIQILPILHTTLAPHMYKYADYSNPCCYMATRGHFWSNFPCVFLLQGHILSPVLAQ